MSREEENKALVRAFVAECINGGDLAAFDKYVDPDLVNYTAPPGLPPGRAGWKLNRQIVGTAFPDFYSPVENLIAERDQVVVVAPFAGTHQGEFFGIPATGRRVHVRAVHILRITGGQIVELTSTSDDLGLMQQLGLTLAPAADPALVGLPAS